MARACGSIRATVRSLGDLLRVVLRAGAVFATECDEARPVGAIKCLERDPIVGADTGYQLGIHTANLNNNGDGGKGAQMR